MIYELSVREYVDRVSSWRPESVVYNVTKVVFVFFESPNFCWNYVMTRGSPTSNHALIARAICVAYLLRADKCGEQ